MRNHSLNPLVGFHQTIPLALSLTKLVFMPRLEDRNVIPVASSSMALPILRWKTFRSIMVMCYIREA